MGDEKGGDDLIAERNRRVEDLVLRYGDAVRTRAKKEGWSAEEAEDLLQEVAVLLLARWGEIRFPAGWLLEVARRQSIMGFRRVARRREVPLEAEGVAELNVASFEEVVNARIDCAALLSRLSERARRAMVRRYLFGDSLAEASQRAGYSKESFGRVRLASFARMRA